MRLARVNNHEYTLKVAGGAVVIAEPVYRGHVEAQVGCLELNDVSVNMSGDSHLPTAVRDALVSQKGATLMDSPYGNPLTSRIGSIPRD